VPISVLLPVLVFIAMGVVVALALSRLMVVGGRARRSSQGLRLASDVAHRAEVLIGDLAAQLEGLRRHGRDVPNAAETAAAGAARLTSLAAEARTVRDRTAEPAVAALVVDLERALRSLQLIEHGRAAILDGDNGNGEGETSVKRGYLNLLHCREAIRQRGIEIRAASLAPVGRVPADRA
jgi:hypothetical protein